MSYNVVDDAIAHGEEVNDLEDEEEVNADYVLEKVDDGLGYQFMMYSWSDMIDDLDLTDKEKSWAKAHTSYRAIIC